MATEKRLIDANAFKLFLEDVRQCYLEEDTFSSNLAAELIETVQDNYLELAPTVDAVEVVRCKDCEFFSKTLSCVISKGMFSPTPMDFCSCGKKKGGTGNGI